MKRFARFFALLLVLCTLSGCVSIDMPDPQPQTVYASFWPVYALSEGICRDVPNLSLYCLVQPQDGCIRSYSLSDWDAALLQGADLLILGGRGLESFEGGFSAGDIPVLTAMENMPLLQNGEAEEDDHFTGVNPWYFLSIPGARNICSVIAAGMGQLDPDFADIYVHNLDGMLARFDSLEKEMNGLTKNVHVDGAVIMQEGIVYFARDVGIENYIEIRREAGTDMSDNELEEAFALMEGSGYTLVLIEKQAPQGLIEAIEARGYTVCRIDILTNHSATEGADAYFEAMRANVTAYVEAASR